MVFSSLPTRRSNEITTVATVGISKGILDRRTERTSPQPHTTTRRQTGDEHQADPPPTSPLLLDQQQQQQQQQQQDVEPQHPPRCPTLHKVIRTRHWERVHDEIQRDPRTVRQCNRHGWSSLLLAIYHGAPDWIIQSMLQSQLQSSPTCTKRTRQRGGDDQPPHSTVNITDLLSRAVPNGKRLCLHFAARYTDDLHIFQLLVEPYPTALLTRSDDGMVPLDRARFYQKDAAILDYLQQQMAAEQNRVDLQSYNRTLRETVVACCETAASTLSPTDGGMPTVGPAGSSNRNEKHNDDVDNDDDNDDDTKDNVALVRRLYRHAQERAMPGLFRHTILDYVGVHRLPVIAATATTTAADITSDNAISR